MERGSVSLAGGTGRRIVGGARSIASWGWGGGGKSAESKKPNEKKTDSVSSPVGSDGGSGTQYLIPYPGYPIDLLYI